MLYVQIQFPYLWPCRPEKPDGISAAIPWVFFPWCWRLSYDHSPDISWIAVARPRRWVCHLATAGCWFPRRTWTVRRRDRHPRTPGRTAICVVAASDSWNIRARASWRCICSLPPPHNVDLAGFVEWNTAQLTRSSLWFETGLQYSEKEQLEQRFFGQLKCLTVSIKCVISTL